MNSSSDLSINNHNSSASTIVPSQQQGTSEITSAKKKIPAVDDQFEILKSQHDEHTKKITEFDKTFLDFEKRIRGLQEEMKETIDKKTQEFQKTLAKQIRDSEQKFNETVDKKITDQQTQIITLCGIFVAIIAFVTNNVTIFTKADNLYQALVFMVIFFILTVGIILISHQLLTKIDNKHLIETLILITVTAIALIYFAQNLDRTEVRSHKAYIETRINSTPTYNRSFSSK
jgi:hypothetical protein